MTADQIADVLRKNNMWLRGEDGGQRANLQGVDLQSVDLQDEIDGSEDGAAR